MRVVLAVVALTVGCGTEPGPTKVPAEEYGDPRIGDVSGTRLRQQRAKAADGTIGFVGWYDTERQENCSFTTTFSGQTWCLPKHIRADTKHPYLLFLDQGCTQAAVQPRGLETIEEAECINSARSGSYVLFDWDRNCSEPRMFQEGDAYSDLEGRSHIMVYTQDGDDGCSDEPWFEVAVASIAHAREVPMSSFVSAAIETD